jgi:hypothetical protein
MYPDPCAFHDGTPGPNSGKVNDVPIIRRNHAQRLPPVANRSKPPVRESSASTLDLVLPEMVLS